MLVSHRHKFIYTKTVKTAGTSIEAYFEPLCRDAPVEPGDLHEFVSEAGIVGRREGLPPTGCKWWGHMPAIAIKRRLGDAIWNSYHKFCAIRNPFDKVISHFFFIRRQGWSRKDESLSDREDFESWLCPGMLETFRGTDRDIYTIDGKFCLDSVVRYEHLHQDLAQLCQRLGVPWNPDALPRLRSGHRPPAATVSSMYSARSAGIVRQFYQFEFNHFGYSEKIEDYSGDAAPIAAPVTPAGDCRS